MSWPCPAPEFRYLPERGVWSACVHCRRLAWSHEQADPLADLRIMHAAGPDWDPSRHPPVMRPAIND